MALVKYGLQYLPEAACGDDSSLKGLQDVYIDPDGWLVASDGFIQAAIPCEIVGELGESVGVPNKFFELRGYEDAEFTIEARRASWPSSAACYRPWTRASSRLTQWRTRIPAPGTVGVPPSNEHLVVQPQLLSRLCDALAVQIPTIIWHQGEGPHIVMDGAGAFGLIMPVKLRPEHLGKLDAVLALHRAKAEVAS